MSIIALISQDKTHVKMACGDSKALPAVTLLDPRLTLSQPASVSACTGIDALAHSLESAVTRKRTDLSGRHAGIAFRLLNQFLPIVFSDPSNLNARGGVLLVHPMQVLLLNRVCWVQPIRWLIHLPLDTAQFTVSQSVWHFPW